MSILLSIHSIIRWVVVILMLVVLVKYALGWALGHDYSKLDRQLLSAFISAFAAQVTLGILLLVIVLFTGGLVRYQVEHAVTMLIAAFLVTRTTRWKSASSSIKFRNNTILILVVLVLVFVGVSALPQG